MNIVALDTETHLIAPRQCMYTDCGLYVPGTTSERHPRAVLTSGFVPPKLVVGSWYELDGSGGRVGAANTFLFRVHWYLKYGWHTVWHNLAFDYAVCCAADPQLKPLFWKAAEEGRLHDTMYLDMLYGLSRGRYDQRTFPNFGREELKPRSLDTLALQYVGMQLDKDPAIRLNFAQFDGVWPIPDNFYKYALQDAEATAKVYDHLVKQCPDNRLWGEAIQIKAALAFADMDQRGVHIDTEEAARLKQLFEADLPALEVELVGHGLGLWKPKKGTLEKYRQAEGGPRDLSPTWHLRLDGTITRTKVYTEHSVVERAKPEFHLKLNAVRGALAPIAAELGEPPPTTDGGLLSLDGDFWRDHIPPERADLLAWGRHEKLKKIISGYLKLYSTVSHVYPRWNNLGARSGRTSAANPNIQNVPKRKHGIRSLFVPAPGKVFIRADYGAQEVYTLCEAMHHLGIDGPLYETLTTGGDIHCRNAGRMLGRPAEAIGPDSPERQLAKVLIFGVGGGLGPKKLADSARKDYNLPLTVEEAKHARGQFLDVFWDIQEYLDSLNRDLGESLQKETGRGIQWWMRELGVDRGRGGMLALKRAFNRHPNPNIRGILFKAEQNLNVTLPTGQVRAFCTYTEGANTYFQGLAAAVTKEAMFRCLKAGLEIVLAVHDEIVVECLPCDAERAASQLRECMLDGFKALCPHVGAFAKVDVKGPLQRWGKATSKEGVPV